MPEHVITGDHEARVVRFDGVRLDPGRCQGLLNYSRDGFAWGYEGSAPAQLALAILLKAGVAVEDAVRLHRQFKREFLATVPFEGALILRVDVLAWVDTHRGTDGARR